MKGNLMHFVLFIRAPSYLPLMQALPLYLCACRVATNSQALPGPLRRVGRVLAGISVSVSGPLRRLLHCFRARSAWTIGTFAPPPWTLLRPVLCHQVLLQGWQARRAPHSRAQPAPAAAAAGAPTTAALAAAVAPNKEALLQQVAQLVPDLARE
jgi:hypothetical protein